MISYKELLDELKPFAEEGYARFNGALLKNDKITVLGVRVPTLRKIAKKYAGDAQTLLTFPNEVYEVNFVALAAASYLSYEEFVKVVDGCVARIDNWAVCDCFKAKNIAAHTEDFLFYVHKYLAEDSEFYQRYALTTLLYFYVKREYLQEIFSCVLKSDRKFYYVHMAAAWLIAEVLARFYGDGVAFLKSGALDAATHNKAIQKATESFRLSETQKNELKGLKRRNYGNS